MDEEPVTEPHPLPLDGVRILDLSHYLAGPFATMILGDLGADVIKVEPPHGDITRNSQPYRTGDLSTFFFSVNRNKRSIVLDLKSDHGREAFLELATTADIVCNNFRPGVMERLGIGWDTLHAANPVLVLCSIYGYEREGPMAERPALDGLVQALAGVMDITGEPDRGPSRVGHQLGDTAAGLWAVIAMLSGLAGRHRTGRGDHVEVSLLDSQLSLLTWQAQNWFSHGVVPERSGGCNPTRPPSQTIRCRDGRYLYVSVANDPRWWTGFCRAMGDEGFATNPDYATLTARQRNVEALTAEIDAVFATRDSDEWLERLHAEGVPAALVQRVDEALDMPLVRRRGMAVEVELDDGSRVRMLGNPVKGSGAERFAPAPRLGEHTDEVLRSVGVRP